MAGFLSSKTKRKDLEEVYDDFSEFSLSSPAKKIRRLDADLPPIMEEEDPSVPLHLDQQVPEELVGSTMVDVEAPLSLNEERALVLYKPINNRVVLFPNSGNVSYCVDSELVHGLKNRAFWPDNFNAVRIEEVPTHTDSKQADVHNRLAVIPWAASQVPSSAASESNAIPFVEEPMDAEDEAGGASMEIEEESIQPPGVSDSGEDGMHQWQQHCMIPQPPQNTSTPIMWS